MLRLLTRLGSRVPSSIASMMICVGGLLAVQLVKVAVGETVKCHSAHPPSTFSSCFNRDEEGVSSK